MSKKILIFATHDHGGAGESAYRITKAIKELGYEAGLIVHSKSKSDSFVIQVEEKGKRLSLGERFYNKAVTKLLPEQKKKLIIVDKNYCFFNADESDAPISSIALLEALPFKPDVIILAWVTNFINTETASILQKHTGAKIFWLMTDMAPITGGCHYAWDCKGYTNDCANCPAILSEEYKDRAKQNLILKKKNITEGDVKVIAGSGWTYNQASESTLFHNQKTIPILNGLIDFSLFNNFNRDIAKKVFGISHDTKVIFSGATYTGEERKGTSVFVQSLQKLYDSQTDINRSNTKILIAGNNLDENEYVRQIPFEIIPINFIKDERLLALAYQAADVYVCSSLEDSGPMMVNEALACGTPVVGFEMGLLYNMIQNDINGFKVRLGDSTALATAINEVLSLDDSRFLYFSANAIKMVEEYASLEALQRVMSQITSNLE